MLWGDASNKKNDNPTPDAEEEHIPLVRLDDSTWTSTITTTISGAGGEGALRGPGPGSSLQHLENAHKAKDALLDDMESAVDRLGSIAHSIRGEVIEHNEMLDNLDEELDDADQTMGTTMKKITKLLGTSDRGRLCCILWLVIINVILIIILIFF
mmetsp:Transcript_15260/g.21443  ORF Transcript_15260/g.21443 Transcript_15260/m.21443 type:complete len:155 (-) Transcript_15260:115-579(-)|eukprot:CAMPEP_0184479226 /NCGR_PEP_ID=MMETSP0113_2-20130426/1036_1 /TAXON_ID=91329 /ORGANISM="Norrisiella sphaerica, Strain BC52" /LENGTH=154 /DNA_ID=CAMNT_0026857263 /DNA_START=325 /DNA_END=789 /DNA_ORIENTATION=+